MVDIIIVDIDRLLWMVDKYRRGSSLASAGIPAQSTLTLGSLWHGNILFEYFPVCLHFSCMGQCGV